MDIILKELNKIADNITKENTKQYIRDEENYTIKELTDEIEDPDDIITIFEIPERDIVIIMGQVYGLASWFSQSIFYISFEVKEYIEAFMIRKSDYQEQEEKIKNWIYHS